MSIDLFHSDLTILEFDTFCNDYGIGSDFGPELPGPNDTIRDFPKGKIDPFDSLKGWREKFFWVNASVAPIATRWFFGKEFPQDSAIDGVDGDMILETLLNDNPTRIRRCLGLFTYVFILLLASAFLTFFTFAEMRLQDFIKVPNPFDVVCTKKKLAENERLVLEQTDDVVTSPSDHVVNLAPVPLNQVFPAIPFAPTNVKKRSPAQAQAGESASKKGKSVGESSSDDVVAGESASKADDVMSARLSDDLPLIIASKAKEFILGILIVAPKRLVGKGKIPSAPRKPLSKKGHLVIYPPKSVIDESLADSSHEAADDLCSSEAGSKQLILKGSSKTSVSLSSTSTHSEPLVLARLRPRSAPVSHHFLGIIFDLVEDSAKTPREDRFYASMSMDPACELAGSQLERRLSRCDAALEKKDVEIARLQKLVNKKPSGEMARLRLGFEGAEKEVGRLRKQVEDLKKEASKLPELLALYSQKETDLSTINGKYQDILREKEQLELRNTSLRGQLDEEAEAKAEFSWKLTDYHRKFNEDAKKTKEFLIGKGFRYFLNKFKESDLLGSWLGACISTAISDGMRQVHHCTDVPYAGDASATAQDVTPVEGVVTVESDEVPAGTVPNDNVAVTLVCTLDVLNSNLDTLIIPTSSIFE
ncbi:hypothetical protein Tco_1410589 [Tanacetum coccineum]